MPIYHFLKTQESKALRQDIKCGRARMGFKYMQESMFASPTVDRSLRQLVIINSYRHTDMNGNPVYALLRSNYQL